MSGWGNMVIIPRDFPSESEARPRTWIISAGVGLHVISWILISLKTQVMLDISLSCGTMNARQILFWRERLKALACQCESVGRILHQGDKTD